MSSLVHHSPTITKILKQALRSEEPAYSVIHHPFLLDILLSMGLLMAAGGFTMCLVQMYVGHNAEQCLIRHDYKSAIALLRQPFAPARLSPSFGYDTAEMLNEALYKDALGKLELGRDVSTALSELQSVSPGSAYFFNAQRLLNEQVRPSNTILQGGTAVVAAPVPASSAEKLDYLLQQAEDNATRQ